MIALYCILIESKNEKPEMTSFVRVSEVSFELKNENGSIILSVFDDP